MIKIFKTFGGYVEINEPQKSCWINVTNPTSGEINQLRIDYGLPTDLINDILDQDERPRIEFDDDWTLIILRIPVEVRNNGVPFHTIPLGIFITRSFTLTLCLQDNEVLPIIQPSPFRDQYKEITDSINFILRLFLRSGNLYLRFLKQINQMTSMIEQDLEKSIKNKELNKLLKMEKCLVYFITSIKANEIVLAKLRNSKKITTQINEDLLEDAFIENKQAREMAQIYSDIQSGMMDAFASVISNNLNVVMKQLTLISIILMIPTLIASMFGMNVPNFMEDSLWAMPSIILGSLILSILGVILFRRRQWL
ncbi:MAG: magnesium transporter [Zunongwangia sp.]|uniref:Mg2+ transporter protein, CorA family protein n=2 Tax=Zunongwangia profunda TaxID=398743 RepID=D5BK84_ZUNPS|nr:magnesium transporter CorA family protein [Zunongwangia profunda]ADF51764.1 Mg2+ transporter protein, CorA family protein [Zunongwangia profunda SM-A87]MAO34567.1 magnesium transporter [Zunongwangia sp.]MAS69829.1 magnesium transporter [Zunongwangia sp.]HCV79898.1 magnesium transporter CorA family protein [Zunongwangia profunda]|tara:strand:+ start:22 stop:951 length:930 start_codon:yes stop_codon:yes gene_type:complete